MRLRWLAAVFGVPALLAALWTVFAGKDLNWDLLHYHYYVAQALVEGRPQDYFAARAEGYFNPLGYLPFYAMVAAGWHSVLASMALAALHSASIGLLFLLCWRLLPHRPARERAVLSALGAALGAATAVFWATAGTSFLDPLLLLPMVGGVLLLVAGSPANALRYAAAAGLLFGLAASLKYSNAFYALAALVLVTSLRSAAAYAAGGALAVALFAGPWLLRLWRETGNPFFPHLNALFGSPDAPALMLAAERFAPQGAFEALTLPLRMALPEAMTYAEIIAPDLRLGALVLALPVLAFVRPGSAGLRLLGFLLLCLAAWVATSANARYGLLVLVLVGPCLVLVADRLALFRYCALALATLLVAQALACAAISPTRWFIAERWTQHWFAFEAPRGALEQPALYLTTEAQSMTVAAPFLHRGASLMSLQGRRADSALLERIDSAAQRSGGRVRVLGRGLRPQADGRPRQDVLPIYDATLARFGYRVDAADCFAIPWNPVSDDRLSRWANALSSHPESREPVMSLAACGVLAATRTPAELEEERRVSAAFERAEHECASLFRGQTAVTERLGTEWARSYPGLEVRVETRGGRLVFAPFFKLTQLDLGPLGAPACAPP
jgi:hypothetical protein